MSFVLVQMKKIPGEEKKDIKLYQTSTDQRDSWFNYTVEESQGGGLLSEEKPFQGASGNNSDLSS